MVLLREGGRRSQNFERKVFRNTLHTKNNYISFNLYPLCTLAKPTSIFWLKKKIKQNHSTYCGAIVQCS